MQTFSPIASVWLMVSSECRSLLVACFSCIFLFAAYPSGVTSRKSPPRALSRSFPPPCFLLGVLGSQNLMFKSLIQVHLCEWCKWGSNFIVLSVIIQFSNTIYSRDCPFHIEYSWLSCQMLVDCICMSLFLGSLFCAISLYVCFYASTILF